MIGFLLSVVENMLVSTATVEMATTVSKVKQD